MNLVELRLVADICCWWTRIGVMATDILWRIWTRIGGEYVVVVYGSGDDDDAVVIYGSGNDDDAVVIYGSDDDDDAVVIYGSRDVTTCEQNSKL